MCSLNLHVAVLLWTCGPNKFHAQVWGCFTLWSPSSSYVLFCMNPTQTYVQMLTRRNFSFPYLLPIFSVLFSWSMVEDRKCLHCFYMTTLQGNCLMQAQYYYAVIIVYNFLLQLGVNNAEQDTNVWMSTVLDIKSKNVLACYFIRNHSHILGLRC